ncbi:MAG: flagellar basal body L-ring protein FlgH [Alphaproteobacteria bacterium]|nr:flagellar basal body L-ring protein FlgH [Alphaproteobacteria bacterium]
MSSHSTFNYRKLLISTAAILSLSLGACSMPERLANVGKAPDLAPIKNPAENGQYKTVSMPMPQIAEVKPQKNSLWGGDKQTFFKDQRAHQVGDILTVMIDIDDEAELENESQRSRSANEGAGLDSFLGYELDLPDILSEGINNADLVDANSTSSSRGSGSTEREEEVRMKLAATVTQVLPNGNMLIQGRQEVRVNFEKRILELAGVIRPEDITVDNAISYEKIAEARISYGGKGQITDVQQPRYGHQVYDILFPF